LSSSGGTVSLLNRAPHPNAARVFVNWFLSRRGQIAYQELSLSDEPPNSLRIDIPKDAIPIEERLVEGAHYMDLNQPDFDRAPVLKLLNEVLKANVKRW
jgi:ABC-type Fe3+ transport system substrate-binding protein